MNDIIGVFDSGVGGMTTLAEIRKLLPTAQIIYYNDHAHCPYGSHTKSELLAITSQIVQELKAQGARIIVIACNTATTQCIDDLRKIFPELAFVGTEPALKLASDAGCQSILLMATPGTVNSARAQSLVQRQTAERQITLLPCQNLAKLIEDATALVDDRPIFHLNQAIVSELAQLFGSLDIERFDAIVLGCTHYVYMKSYIQNLVPAAKIFDGNLGVAQQVQSLLLGHGNRGNGSLS